MIKDLAGRNALVTGAAGGLGGYIARALSVQGVNLALSDLPGADMSALLEDVRSDGVRAEPVPADLSVPAEANALVAAAEVALGPIDILVNNAGLESAGPFERLDPYVLERTINVNLLSVVLLTRAALPGMLARGSGHVVTISSVAGKMAMAYLAPYSTTKYGVAALMRALAAEIDDGRIGFSTIFPGAISQVGMAAEGEQIKTKVPVPKRLLFRPPEHIGRAVISAIRDGRAEVIVSAQPVRIPALLHAVAPRLGIWLNRGLPKRAMKTVLRNRGAL